MVIYKTTNLTNGKFYVGKDSKNNPDYLGSGSLLLMAIKKYGKTSFRKEILEVCDINSLSDRERYWINELNATDRAIAYNISEGGDGGDNLTNHPDLENIKRKISEGQLGRKAWNEGVNNPYSKEHIDRIRASRASMTGPTASNYVVVDLDRLKLLLENNTINKTAKILGLSVTCIRAKIKEFNIDYYPKPKGNFRKLLSADEITRIREMRGDYMSIEEIAKAIGVGIHKLKYNMRLNNISTKRIR